MSSNIRHFKTAAHELRRNRPPEQSLAQDTYRKIHLAIQKGAYENAKRDGVYNYSGQTSEGILRLTEIIEPTTDEFLFYLKRVGSPYGWDRRMKYQPQGKQELDELIAGRETKLFVFKIEKDGHKHDIGFCLVAGIDEQTPGTPESYRKGLHKGSLIQMFRRQQSISQDNRPVEIYKFGLFPEATGKGYGAYYLSKVLQELIEKREHYDIVYLDTRNTNHSGVVPFYHQHAVKTFHEELLPNDLVDESQIDPPLPSDAKAVLVNGNTPNSAPAVVGP